MAVEITRHGPIVTIDPMTDAERDNLRANGFSEDLIAELAEVQAEQARKGVRYHPYVDPNEWERYIRSTK